MLFKAISLDRTEGGGERGVCVFGFRFWILGVKGGQGRGGGGRGEASGGAKGKGKGEDVLVLSSIETTGWKSAKYLTPTVRAIWINESC